MLISSIRIKGDNSNIINNNSNNKLIMVMRITDCGMIY